MPATVRSRLGWLGLSFHRYRRSWLPADLGAGVMLLAIAVPEQLAAVRLAGMPPIALALALALVLVLALVLASAPENLTRSGLRQRIRQDHFLGLGRRSRRRPGNASLGGGPARRPARVDGPAPQLRYDTVSF